MDTTISERAFIKHLKVLHGFFMASLAASFASLMLQRIVIGILLLQTVFLFFYQINILRENFCNRHQYARSSVEHCIWQISLILLLLLSGLIFFNLVFTAVFLIFVNPQYKGDPYWNSLTNTISDDQYKISFSLAIQITSFIFQIGLSYLYYFKNSLVTYKQNMVIVDSVSLLKPFILKDYSSIKKHNNECVICLDELQEMDEQLDQQNNEDNQEQNQQLVTNVMTNQHLKSENDDHNCSHIISQAIYTENEENNKNSEEISNKTPIIPSILTHNQLNQHFFQSSLKQTTDSIIEQSAEMAKSNNDNIPTDQLSEDSLKNTSDTSSSRGDSNTPGEISDKEIDSSPNEVDKQQQQFSDFVKEIELPQSNDQELQIIISTATPSQDQVQNEDQDLQGKPANEIEILDLFSTIIQLPCKHSFHYECISKWVESSQHLKCPTCRHTIPVS